MGCRRPSTNSRTVRLRRTSSSGRSKSTGRSLDLGEWMAANLSCIGTALFIYAHPDDESFVSGTPMKLAAAGHTIALLTLTRGDAGLWLGKDFGSRWKAELGTERAQEWAAAVATIRLPLVPPL